MSYPYAIASGNAVIAAALEWDDRRDEADRSDCPYFNGTGTCSYGCQTEPSCQTDRPRGGWPTEGLLAAIAAHRAATAAEQAQGPDIDTDTQGPRHDAATPDPATA